MVATSAIASSVVLNELELRTNGDPRMIRVIAIPSTAN
jgi:hypothetical protein